jgi:rhamnogalacturonyl hydrolase YesR
MQYLRSDGSFSWQLQAIDGHLDTSVISMLGYAIANHNNLDGQHRIYEEEAEKMLNCLLDNVSDDGLVQNSSAECRGFSMYPQVFEVNSWGQGFGLLFIIEMMRSGE